MAYDTMAGAPDDYDAELQRLYEIHNPGKLADLPHLKRKYGAAALLAKARFRYEGVAVTPPTSPLEPEPEARLPSHGEMEAAMMEASKLTAILALGATRRTTTRVVHEMEGLPLEDRPSDPLHRAIASGDTAAVRAMHEDGPLDLRQPWCRQSPALVIEVVQRGHVDMLRYMISTDSVDLGVLTSTGRTLLMVAVRADQYAAAQVLLGSGRCRDTVNVHSGFDSMTALHLCQQLPMARLLLHYGADWRLKNARGHTVRQSAAAATAWAANRPRGAASRSNAAMGCSQEVANWLGQLESKGYTPLGFQRTPLVCLHHLALDGRATQRPPPSPAGSAATTPAGHAAAAATAALQAAQLRAVLQFVFPGPEESGGAEDAGPGPGLSLPSELLPRIICYLVR